MTIAELVSRAAPDVELIRHAAGDDLHCIAFYDSVPAPTTKAYFSESMMAGVKPGDSLASKIQAVGAFRRYRLKTSTQTTVISKTISQANVLPTQVLMPSMV